MNMDSIRAGSWVGWTNVRRQISIHPETLRTARLKNVTRESFHWPKSRAFKLQHSVFTVRCRRGHYHATLLYLIGRLTSIIRFSASDSERFHATIRRPFPIGARGAAIAKPSVFWN